MAAIKPHLERQDDPSETQAERRYSSQGTFEQKFEGLSGLGDSDGPSPVYPLTKEANASLQASHSELVRLAYSRDVVAKQLAGKSFTVQAKTFRDGTGEVVLVLDEPVAGAPWNAAGKGDMRNFKLLSWTQKMGTPSFSLPAGAPHIGGTCPGASGGQSVVPQGKLRLAQAHVTAVTGKPVLLADATCERCYATGGNYAYGSMVLSQMVRAMWVESALKDGTFVDTMSWAVEHADYLLQGGTVEKVGYDPERHPGRFFRIHDSGDFFSARYLRAWKEVTNNFKSGPSKITFWAPTRIWATPWGIQAVNEVNSDRGSNLIIRPSTYHINENTPESLGPGWAAWSVCWAKRVKDKELVFPNRSAAGQSGRARGAEGGAAPFGWDCQAYAVTDEAHSCRNARGPKRTGAGPNGDTGCRACWVASDTSVNYTEH